MAISTVRCSDPIIKIQPAKGYWEYDANPHTIHNTSSEVLEIYNPKFSIDEESAYTLSSFFDSHQIKPIVLDKDQIAKRQNNALQYLKAAFGEATFSLQTFFEHLGNYLDTLQIGSIEGKLEEPTAGISSAYDWLYTDDTPVAHQFFIQWTPRNFYEDSIPQTNTAISKSTYNYFQDNPIVMHEIPKNFPDSRVSSWKFTLKAPGQGLTLNT